MLQTIEIDGKRVNLFFDSGCGDMVCRKGAVFNLGKKGRASCEIKGPLVLSGVGDNKTVSTHGVYRVSTPMHDGNDNNISGICLDTVTAEFPKYDIRMVERDIHSAYLATGQNPENLPKLPSHVGGKTNLMIEIKYLSTFPKQYMGYPRDSRYMSLSSQIQTVLEVLLGVHNGRLLRLIRKKRDRIPISDLRIEISLS